MCESARDHCCCRCVAARLWRVRLQRGARQRRTHKRAKTSVYEGEHVYAKHSDARRSHIEKYALAHDDVAAGCGHVFFPLSLVARWRRIVYRGHVVHMFIQIHIICYIFVAPSLTQHMCMSRCLSTTSLCAVSGMSVYVDGFVLYIFLLSFFFCTSLKRFDIWMRRLTGLMRRFFW